MLPNYEGKTAFNLMNLMGHRVLVDTLLGLISFPRIINVQEEFKELLDVQDPNMIKFIESSLLENEYTQKFVRVNIPSTSGVITFRSDNGDLSQDELQKNVDQSIIQKKILNVSSDDVAATKVRTYIIDLGWLLADTKGFLDLVPNLEQYKDDNLFQTEFIKSVTNEFWSQYQKSIIVKTLLPWLLYLVVSNVYFVYTLDKNTGLTDGDPQLFKLIVEVVLIVTIGYEIFQEVREAFSNIKNYLQSPYNYIDFAQYAGALLIVVTNMVGYSDLSMTVKRTICLVVVICQGIKLIIDWLRLFDDTSFYVTLIIRTIIDISYFAFILFIMLYFLGIAVYMLQLNALDGEQYYIVYPVF